MRALSLFSGAGGLDIAAEMAGIEIAGQCEIDKACNRVLRHWWPDTPRWEDVRDVTCDTVREEISMGKLSKDLNRAVLLYEDGFSIENIAALYGVTRQSMWKCLKRRGVEFRDNKRYGEENHFYRGGSLSDDHAQNMVEYAVRTGTLIRPENCSECGLGNHYTDGRSCIQAHHCDYNKPLDVMWLCKKCHHEWHKHNQPVPKGVVECEAAEEIDIVFGGFPDLVNHTALQDAVRQLVTSVISGRSCGESFAKLSPDGSWVKTFPVYSQVSLTDSGEVSSEPYCETWPKWGTASDGVCGVPVTWARRTNGKGSSSWPTATVHGNHNRAGCSEKAGDGLATAVKDWPTATAADSHKGGPNCRDNKGYPSLTGAVCQQDWPTPRANKIGGYSSPGYSPTLEQEVNWATPNAADSTGTHGGGQTSSLRTDTYGNGGVLNPEWVEPLMGFPIGFTSPAGLPDAEPNNTTTSRPASCRPEP